MTRSTGSRRAPTERETSVGELPLSGVRVVTVEQAVSAPFCSRQLADLGADVIKVERPDGGDIARGYDGVLRGESAYFAWLNRGKRSIVLDLRGPDGGSIARRLLDRADVFVHNLAPGAVERLGLGYDELRERNPGLVWCGISGYGPDGPYREKKAYDLLVQGESGVVALTGTSDAPAKVGISVADIAAGLYAYSSILAALLRRERGEPGGARGGRIDISMLECLAEWVTPPFYVWHGTGRSPGRAGLRHNMIVPYGAYACADGPVMLAVQSDREWRRFAERVLGLPGLAEDARYSANEGRVAHRVSLEELIESQFRERSRAEVTALLERADIPTGLVNDIPTVAAHPQLAARGRWRTVDTPHGPIPALTPPHNLQGAPARMGAVPGLGEHGAEILAELDVGR